MLQLSAPASVYKILQHNSCFYQCCGSDQCCGIDQHCVVVSGDSKRPRGRGGRAAGLLVLATIAAQVSSPSVLGLVCHYNRSVDTFAYLSTRPHSRVGRERHSDRARTSLRLFGVLPWPARERRWARLCSACACVGASRSRNLQAWAT